MAVCGWPDRASLIFLAIQGKTFRTFPHITFDISSWGVATGSRRLDRAGTVPIIIKARTPAILDPWSLTENSGGFWIWYVYSGRVAVHFL